MSVLGGTCDDRFEALAALFGAYLDEGLDVGAAVAVVLGGDVVVDLWGGFADPFRTVPWQADTVVDVWSCTKVLTNLCALALAGDGALDLDAPVARYWPAFGASGKSAVLVRHLLGHTAGLAGWDAPMRVEDLFDWERCTGLLAAQAPWWAPGTAAGYHPVTQGYLVGEVVRRVAGATVAAVVAERFARPLGADVSIGAGGRPSTRIATLVPPPPVEWGPDPASLAGRAYGNPRLRAEDASSARWRAAEVPAANGHASARGLALVASALACRGESPAGRVMAAAACDAVFRTQARGVDLVAGIPVHHGCGLGIAGEEMPLGPDPRTCYWGGWGGSLVVADLDARMSVAYVMNRMAPGTGVDERGAALVHAAHAGLAG